jgi:hypothetical protein
VRLARNASGRGHVSRYAEGIAVGVATTPFALRRPSTDLRRGPLCRELRSAIGIGLIRRGSALRRRPYALRRGRSTPTSYAEGCRRRIVRRGHIPIRRRPEALGIELDSCSGEYPEDKKGDIAQSCPSTCVQDTLDQLERSTWTICFRHAKGHWIASRSLCDIK